MRHASTATAAAASLTIALVAAGPADASSKSCGTVAGTLQEVYKVAVSPSSISCSTARSVLNAFRTKQEQAAQSGKSIPAKGVMVKSYRCRAPKPTSAGGYVTSKWICTKGSRRITGVSKQLNTG